MKTAILYASDEGQTRKIAHYIGAHLRNKGQAVDIIAIKDLTPDFELTDYNRVIIGASVHYSSYQSHAVKWIKANLYALQHVPNAFFSVCMAASDTSPAGQSEAQGYIKTFVKQTGWIPDHIGSFGGALMFEEYGFLKGLLMKQLVRIKRLDADTKRNNEFTDWQQVDQFIVSQSTL